MLRGIIARLRDMDIHQKTIDAPVFIVGSPRSGTTWVQQLLLGSDEVCGGQESFFFKLFAPPIEEYIKPWEEFRYVGLRNYLTREQVFEAIYSLWRQMILLMVEQKPTAHIFLEKTPDHAFALSEIHALL